MKKIRETEDYEKRRRGLQKIERKYWEE